MSEQTIAKLAIAAEYLDAAIEFFLDERNFFCAIHLSAAAEELFGAHLEESERHGTLAWKAEKQLLAESGPTASDADARKSVNKWKNEVKHLRDVRALRIDPVFVAQHHIEAALRNFYKLRLQKSRAVWQFEDWHNQHARQTAGISLPP